MKIAFFTDTYEPQINGVVKSIKSFENILRKKGHEVYIFCPRGPKTKYDKNVFPVESFRFLPYPEYRVGLPSFDIIDKFREINPDVVHIHSPASIGATGLALGKLFKKPVIMTYHTLLTEYFDYIGGEQTNKKVAKNFSKWFFRKALVVVVPSNSTKNLLRSYGLKSDIIVIPNPVDMDKIKSVKKRKNSEPVILHVGRLCKEKKIDIVIKAFKEVLKHRKAKLVIASDGPYKKQLQNLVKELGIGKNVKFTGYLDTKDLMKLYAKSDLFVSASDVETQGIVLLEAFANGCPVVVRNAIGFNDYVIDKKNGLLFEDEKDLVKKTILVLENKKLRNKIVKNGYKTVNNLTKLRLSENIYDLYENVNGKDMRLRSHIKLLYGISLFVGLVQSWFYTKTNLLESQGFLKIYFRIIKLISKLQYF